MRTTKIQRTAYNFTKMAAYIPQPEWNHEFREAAKDAGLACIDYESLCGDEAQQRFVFVPQKEWDDVSRRFEFDLKHNIEDPKACLRNEVTHWYNMAQLHN